MTTQRFALATVVGGITLFVLGFLIYGVLLMDFFAANTGSATGALREVPLFWSLGLGELALAALLTLAIGGWARKASAADGLKTGAVVGLLLSLAVGLTFYGVTNMSNLTATLTDIVVGTVRLALAGAAIGAVLSKGASPQ